VHGGPYGAWGNTFYFQAQALAGSGYASLYVNPRGSLGYGHTFAAAADWGRKDFQDLMAAVDAALARCPLDPDRTAITGISYGGFMTNWAIGHTDRFAAAVSVNGVSSFFSMYGVSDITAVWFENGFDVRGPFWRSDEHLAFFRDRSPITYADSMETPLLLLQSENDYRCPIEQGEQLLTALRMRGRVVELIRFPGASHVISASGTPHQRYLQWRLARDWFDRYVKAAEAAVSVETEERAEVTLAGAPAIAAGEPV
jgi:dipeptidyl aminopeptidase/acylaminoacyl peptidase